MFPVTLNVLKCSAIKIFKLTDVLLPRQWQRINFPPHKITWTNYRMDVAHKIKMSRMEKLIILAGVPILGVVSYSIDANDFLNQKQ
jgi:hypothetical protein